MSYTPTEWQDGDVITAEKLNKIENGIANIGGTKLINLHVYEVGEPHPDYGLGYLEDITFEEIQTLMRSGAQVCFLYEYNNGGDLYTDLLTLSVLRVMPSGEGRYEISFSTADQNVFGMTFRADTSDGTLITYYS